MFTVVFFFEIISKVYVYMSHKSLLTQAEKCRIKKSLIH